ncbi:MAG: class I SAM-dependent methyltransferase [Solirubrobacteraceae bacterium]|nr:class I SAM-dependent methyltransferase [Solirubrobacteraceae bacterium]
MSEYRDASAAYLETIRRELPLYDRLQDELIKATYGVAVRRILDLGCGTGETSRRALEAYPDAELIAIDPSQDMLQIARAVLPEHAQLRLGYLDEPLPKGSFDLILSALTIQALPPHQRADLFPRVRRALAPRGRLVVADLVATDAAGRAAAVHRTDSLAGLQGRMRDGGLVPAVVWAESGLAVVTATA